jgi:hypothetical protein
MSSTNAFDSIFMVQRTKKSEHFLAGRHRPKDIPEEVAQTQETNPTLTFGQIRRNYPENQKN